MSRDRWTGPVRGVWVAVTTPLWLRPFRIRRLMGEAASLPAESASPDAAIRTARSTLARLARLPFSPWRNTCLYRSIAECRCLRAAGIPARLRIGVRRGGPDSSDPDDVAAHAWVESEAGRCAGLVADRHDQAMAPLRFRREPLP